jgi:hypothetical protein
VYAQELVVALALGIGSALETAVVLARETVLVQ